MSPILPWNDVAFGGQSRVKVQFSSWSAAAFSHLSPAKCRQFHGLEEEEWEEEERKRTLLRGG